VRGLDFVLHAAVVALAGFLAVLPLEAALGFGRLIGLLAYHVLPIRRGVVLANLRHVFGGRLAGREIRAIAWAAYGEFGMTLVEVLRASVADPRRFVDHVEIEGVERLASAAAARTPVLVCSPHAGNFDLLGFAAAAQGLEVHALMRPLNSARFDDFIVRARERMGVKVLMAGSEESFLDCIDLLEAGKLVAMLPDQNARHGVTVDFLGKPASTFKGPAVLALLTGAALVVAVDERLARDPRKHRARLTFLPPLAETGDRDADIRAITQAIADSMSAAILRNPAQYFWFHRRWGKKLA
jgi:KDO2-lipid IV(A) lauroyltransferase